MAKPQKFPGIDAAIRELYPTRGAAAVQERFPQASKQHIQQRANYLGSKRRSTKSTDEEDEYIRQRYPQDGAASVANALGWSAEAVWAKAAYMGVTRKSKQKNRSLTETDVSKIKHRLHNGERRQEIADLFGVSYSTIAMIATGKTWKHVQNTHEPQKD